MILWKRAALLGSLSRLIPFVISFILFPLKKSNAPPFGILTGAALLNRYFRNRSVAVNEAWTYYSEIVPGYLLLPAFAFGAARLAQS